MTATAGEIVAALQCSRPSCPCHSTAAKGRGPTHCAAPGHPDENPSMDVDNRQNGDPIFYCNSRNCPQDEIIAGLKALHLWGDVYANRNGTASRNGASANGHRSSPKPTQPTRKHGYKILDADGQLVAIHWRTDYDDRPKTFSWQMPDGTWKLVGLRPADLPLFGCHHLHKRPDDPVIFCEGEGATEALWTLKRLAVGSVTGASGTPSDAVLCVLAGRLVYLWPDADLPDDKGKVAGLDHMNRMAATLSGMGISVRMIHWNEAPSKGDAADFVAAHPDDATEALQALLDAAEDWKPEPSETTEGKQPRAVQLSTVEPQDVDYLWRPYLAKGKLIVQEGDPGGGKSYVGCAIAAGLSRGFLPGVEPFDPMSSLLLLGEDDLPATIVPRLRGLDADLTRVHALDALIDLSNGGMAVLEREIERIRPAFVLIDPITTFVGGRVDWHRDNEVRGILSILGKLAEQYQCSVALVRHLNKASGMKTAYRGSGSIAVTAIARSVLLVGQDPTTGDRGIIQTKNSLGPIGDPVGFEITGEGAFRWMPKCDLTAGQILSNGDEEGASASDDAESFLRDALSDGERPAKDILQESKQFGIAERTLHRTKSRLGIKTRREGQKGKRGGGSFFWSLPDDDDLDCQPSGGKATIHAQIDLDCHDACTQDGGNLNTPTSEIAISLDGVGNLNTESTEDEGTF